MVRRVVTAVEPSGRSVIHQDAELDIINRDHTPQFQHSVVWTTGTDALGGEPPSNYVPGPGGTVAMMVTFPPDSVFADPSFDGAAAAAENLAKTPGLADLFEPDNPGMHTTPTVDYAVVISGSVVLEVDEGAAVRLEPGDVVVQNGTRHAWRVPSDEPATIFVILMGAAG